MRSRYLAIAIVVLMAAPTLLSMVAPVSALTDRPGNGLDVLLKPERGAGADGSDPSLLRLQVLEFDPLVDSIDLPSELLTQRYDGLFLLQFIGPTRSGWIDAVEDLGGELVSYIPDNGFIATLPREARRLIVEEPFVRWVGPYHPGFRVLTEMWRAMDPVLSLAIMTLDAPEAVADQVLSLGGTLEAVGTRMVQAHVPRLALLPLARNEAVEFIEPIIQPTLFNDNSARLMSARGDDGDYIPMSRRMWTWDPDSGTFQGTTGLGYVASLADTGLDDSHPSFTGHLPTRNYNGGSTTEDTYGHGTHCSGTTAGTGIPYPADQGTLPLGKYAGVAPEATVFMQDIFDGFNFYFNFDVLGREASERNAVVNSNSWGEYRGGRYGSYEAAYDTMVRDAEPSTPGNQNITFCFSAGNGGPGDRTIGSPGAAKNIITVGATGNDKRGVSGNSMASFSSSGPCADGRVKPDVVASGQHVVSAAARPPNRMPMDWAPDGGESWIYASGTSMSCPGVAGAVVLVNDYVEHAWGQPPSPALVKALLINGADFLRAGSTYPNNREGWGRVNLTRLHETPNYRTYFYDQEVKLQVGAQETQRHVLGMKQGERLWVTLVWTDYPGSASASTALVSDLDLVVTSPSGKVYVANNFDNFGHSLSGVEKANDTVNNVEKVYVPQAEQGFWSFDVIAKNTPQGAQDFALVVQGDLVDEWRDIVVRDVELSKEDPDEGEGIRFSGEVRATGNLPVAMYDYEVYVLNTDTDEKTVFEGGAVPGMVPGDRMTFSYTWTAVRGNWEFGVKVDTGGVIQELSELNNERLFNIFVKGYGMDAGLLPEALTVWPGLDAYMEIEVQNTGNVPDTYSICSEGIPVGWEVSMECERITLGVGRLGTVGVRVTPPLAAKAGDVNEMFITVTSEGNSTYRADLEHVATVGHVRGLDAEFSQVQRSVFPGLTAVHVINVTNTGNGMDTFELSLAGIPSGWEAEFSDDEITMEDNVTRAVTLEIKTPERALMNTIADVDVIVSTETGTTEKLKARTRVRQSTGLSSLVTAVADVEPGGKASVHLEVENLGNGVDLFKITELLPNNGWRTNLPVRDLVLDAYELFTADFEVICPRGMLAGDYLFTFQVSSREWFEEHNVTITVLPVYSQSTVMLGGASALYPGNETTFKFQVTNLGNLPTEFELSVEKVPGTWGLDYSETSMTIDPKRRHEFSVTITLPLQTTIGYQRITAVLTYGPSGMEETNITILVLEAPSSSTGGGDDGGKSDLPLYIIIIGAVAILVVVGLLVYLGMRRRGGEAPFEGPVEGDEAPARHSRPLPPPPPDMPPRRAPPRPPRPEEAPKPRPPSDVSELLAGTPAMDRVSDHYDRYSADVGYASGQTFAREDGPVFAGECAKCGGRVMEYASGTLMCEECGTHYEAR